MTRGTDNPLISTTTILENVLEGKRNLYRSSEKVADTLIKAVCGLLSHVLARQFQSR